MTSILVRLEIPIPDENIPGTSALAFTKWLPIGDDQAIKVSQDNLELKLWFDIKSSWWARHISEEELSRHIAVPAHRVYADVFIKSARPELADYLQNPDYDIPQKPEHEQLQNEYDELAWQILSFTLTTLNRMLHYIKGRWGQYWLPEYELDRGQMLSQYGKFKAIASLDNINWFRFSPSQIVSLTASWPDESRLIRREDWNEIRDHVQSAKRPPFAKSLLATAEFLAANGHSRAAITEAVAALEVAVHEFAANPNVNTTLAPRLRDRLGLDTLKKQVDKIGLTASVSYLFPVLLPESILSQSVLDGCRKAITHRQNVIHNGQREVNEEVLQSCLKAIRSMCNLLESIITDAQLVTERN